MRLYTLTKRDFLWTSLVLILAFLAILCVGLTGPSIIQSTVVNSSYFTPPYSIETGPYKLLSPTLSSFNQELWLMSHVKVRKLDEKTIYGRNLNVSVTMFPIDRDGSGSSGLKSYDRKRSLVCKGVDDDASIEPFWCEPFLVLHIGYIRYAKMKLEVRFDGLETSTYPVDDVKFEFQTYSPNFSQFELWFRFSFVIITFLIMCSYAHVLRKFHLHNWTLEQRWVALILPAVMLNNDPFFPLKFLYDSWIPGLIDIVFEASLVCILLMFWLCVYDGITSSGRRFVYFYLPKLILCGLFWISAILLGSWQKYNELQDPTYSYTLDMKHYIGMKVFFYIVVAVYFVYLSYLFIKTCAEIKSKPFFTLRIRFLTALNLLLTIICVAFAIIRFGGAGNLGNNFFAKSAASYQNSVEFVCFYGLINLYVFALAFVYSPSNEEATDGEERHILQSASNVNQPFEQDQDSPC